MTNLLVFDPGLVTGVAEMSYTDDEPIGLDLGYVVTNGALGMSLMLSTTAGSAFKRGYHTVIYERFRLRGNGPPPEIEGVRVEGVLIESFRDTMIPQHREHKHMVPDRVLKDNGLWQTGRMVAWEDGRDVNDAIIHGIYYAAFTQRHRPTLEAFFPDSID